MQRRLVQLYDVFPLKDRINCVLEYCTTDLEQIIQDRSLTLKPADIKSFMQMLLRGLAHCHACWVLHRVRRLFGPGIGANALPDHWWLMHVHVCVDVCFQDLKTNNLLVGADGQLKICDFGMARPFGSPNHKLSHQVVTLYVDTRIHVVCCI